MGLNDETLADLQKDFGQLTTEAEKSHFESEIELLGKFQLIEYAQIRKAKAKELNVTVGILDRLVNAYAQKDEKKPDSIGDEIENGIEPSSEAVDGAEISQEIFDTIKRHIVTNDAYACALTLWIIGTYFFNAFYIFPRLLISSPEKRCGKTTVLRLLAAFVHKGLSTSNISSAALFRAVEAWQPTILIDEGDTFLNENTELGGLINSGHTRDAAYTLRVIGNDKESSRAPKKFSTWSPLAIAMIKNPRDTILDRSIVIRLKRKKPDEKTQKLKFDCFKKFEVVRRKLKRFADDHNEEIKSVEVDIPDIKNDRAEDNWTPLFAVAAVLKNDWLDKAKSALAFIHQSVEDENSIGVMLLHDIQLIFNRLKIDKIHSENLAAELCKLEGRPWAEWKHRSLTQNGLANLLKPFCIFPRQIRIGEINKNGYSLTDFEDVFSRYLLKTPSQSPTILQANSSLRSGEIQNSTDKLNVEFQSDLKPLQGKECRVVEVQKGGIEKKTYFDPVLNQNREEFSL